MPAPTYIGIAEHPSIQHHIINPLQVSDGKNITDESLLKKSELRCRKVGFERTVMLASSVTSHSRRRHAPNGAAPARLQSCDALIASRAVAKTWSPRSRSCRTNSRPMPRVAPTITQVDMMGKRKRGRIGVYYLWEAICEDESNWNWNWNCNFSLTTMMTKGEVA